MIQVNRLWLGVAALAAAVGFSGCAVAPTPDNTQEKVVYHFNNSDLAMVGMNNIKNHLGTSPKAKIVAVTHGKGIDFLLDGAADASGNPYNIKAEELMAKGVEFRVCNNTLKARNIDPKKVIPGAKIVPSGVAEIGRLQTYENYVYLKP